jgi:hypothetical protein
VTGNWRQAYGRRPAVKAHVPGLGGDEAATGMQCLGQEANIEF